MDTKICNHCHETKSLDNFYYRKNKNLYESNCTPCNSKIAKERYHNKAIKEKVRESQKKYYEQNKEKFNEASKAYCENNKDRIKELHKQYYQDNADKLKKQSEKNREILKEKVLSGQLKKPSIKEKTCTNCKLTKDVENFTFRKTRNVYESRCKKCNEERERERRKLHKDKINARRREIAKKPLTIEQRIKHNLRKRVNRYIERRDGKNLYLKLLGCNKQFLIKWFEYNFKLDEQLDITWDNYGSHWHIDHVTPCASFDMNNEEQQKECFHWTNLSPVLKSYNLSKGDKIKPIDQIRQEIRVKNFLKTTDLKNKKYKYSFKS